MDPVQGALAKWATKKAAVERVATRQQKGKRKVGEQYEEATPATVTVGQEGIPGAAPAVATAIVPMLLVAAKPLLGRDGLSACVQSLLGIL